MRVDRAKATAPSGAGIPELPKMRTSVEVQRASEPQTARASACESVQPGGVVAISGVDAAAGAMRAHAADAVSPVAQHVLSDADGGAHAGGGRVRSQARTPERSRDDIVVPDGRAAEELASATTASHIASPSESGATSLQRVFGADVGSEPAASGAGKRARVADAVGSVAQQVLSDASGAQPGGHARHKKRIPWRSRDEIAAVPDESFAEDLASAPAASPTAGGTTSLHHAIVDNAPRAAAASGGGKRARFADAGAHAALPQVPPDAIGAHAGGRARRQTRVPGRIRDDIAPDEGFAVDLASATAASLITSSSAGVATSSLHHAIGDIVAQEPAPASAAAAGGGKRARIADVVAPVAQQGLSDASGAHASGRARRQTRAPGWIRDEIVASDELSTADLASAAPISLTAVASAGGATSLRRAMGNDIVPEPSSTAAAGGGGGGGGGGKRVRIADAVAPAAVQQGLPDASGAHASGRVRRQTRIPGRIRDHIGVDESSAAADTANLTADDALSDPAAAVIVSPAGDAVDGNGVSCCGGQRVRSYPRVALMWWL